MIVRLGTITSIVVTNIGSLMDMLPIDSPVRHLEQLAAHFTRSHDLQSGEKYFIFRLQERCRKLKNLLVVDRVLAWIAVGFLHSIYSAVLASTSSLALLWLSSLEAAFA